MSIYRHMYTQIHMHTHPNKISLCNFVNHILKYYFQEKELVCTTEKSLEGCKSGSDPLFQKNFVIFELLIFESWYTDRLCLFTDCFMQFFVEFGNQNFSSVRIFVFRETAKFLLHFIVDNLLIFFSEKC